MAYSAKKASVRHDKLTDDEIQLACRNALENSLGGPGSEIAQQRLRNLEYYNAEATGELAPPEIDDRSDFVATDVADTVEAMLPQIMRPFVTDDEAVEFQARRPGAEPVAQLATAYINYLFYTKNDGVGVMYDWFKDSLIQKVGFVKVWAEEEYEDLQSTYAGITQEQVAMLQ